MPRRATVTYAPKLAGHRVFVSVGRDDDGKIIEVWVDLHKEGAPLRGFAHALARLASLALQAGTPLDVVVRALLNTDGGPSGDVEDAGPGFETACSVPDLVGRVLDAAGKEQLG